MPGYDIKVQVRIVGWRLWFAYRLYYWGHRLLQWASYHFERCVEVDK